MAIKKLRINDILFSFTSSPADPLTLTISNESGNTQLVHVRSITLSHDKTYYLLHTDSAVYKAWVSRHETGFTVSLLGQGKVFQVQEVKPRITSSRVILPAKKDIQDKQALPVSGLLLPVFKSPLAGRVSKVLVKPGDFVEKGTPLLLVESMKMENELCTSFSGFIKTILIFPQDVVKQGQVLIEFGKEGARDATTQDADGEKTVSNS